MDGASLASLVKSGEFCESLDLPRIDCTGLDLGGGMFCRCNFTGARFDGAKLKEAVFIDCRLNGASLAGANCHHTAFHKSDISGAIFTGATLVATNFTESWLKDASFEGCAPNAVTIVRCDLTGVAGCAGSTRASASRSRSTRATR